MQHYDVILFDVDGTLIDSAPGILNTLEEVFHKMNVDITATSARRSAKASANTFLTRRRSRRPLSFTVRATRPRAAMKAMPTPEPLKCSAA